MRVPGEVYELGIASVSLTHAAWSPLCSVGKLDGEGTRYLSFLAVGAKSGFVYLWRVWSGSAAAGLEMTSRAQLVGSHSSKHQLRCSCVFAMQWLRVVMHCVPWCHNCEKCHSYSTMANAATKGVALGTIGVGSCAYFYELCLWTNHVWSPGRHLQATYAGWYGGRRSWWMGQLCFLGVASGKLAQQGRRCHQACRSALPCSWRLRWQLQAVWRGCEPPQPAGKVLACGCQTTDSTGLQLFQGS